MRTPGLFDLQVNGFAGVDFNDPAITPADVDIALGALRNCGVTLCLPTLITATRETLRDRIRALDRAVKESKLGALMVPGYHLEGPFLNADDGYSGCHPPAAMCDPDVTFVSDLEVGLGRPILLVTLAPERRGSAAAIEALAARGKCVAMGHSAARSAEIAGAVNAGLTLSTHLGNGLPQLLPKLDNTLLAQLAEPRLTACLIADGIHIPSDALRSLVRLKGAERCILVSDAVLAAAAPPGRYVFAGMEVEHGSDGTVREPGKGHLAGSALRLDAAVRNVINWDIAAPAAAIAMANDGPLEALRTAFSHHRLLPDPGIVSWDTEWIPSVVKDGDAGRR